MLKPDPMINDIASLIADSSRCIMLMKLSKSPKINSLNQSIHSEALRKARLCYDHIAGKLGIKLTEALLKFNYIELENDIFYITQLGYKKFIELEIIKNRLKDIKELSGAKCYDWSEKDYHIAGKLGYTIANGLIELCWIKKSLISRELEITEVGKVNLYKNFYIR